MVPALVSTAKRRNGAVGASSRQAHSFTSHITQRSACSLLKPLIPSDVIRREEEMWRGFLGVAAVPALVVLLFSRYLPESPRYLSVVGRHDDAGKVRGGSLPVQDL